MLQLDFLFFKGWGSGSKEDEKGGSQPPPSQPQPGIRPSQQPPNVPQKVETQVGSSVQGSSSNHQGNSSSGTGGTGQSWSSITSGIRTGMIRLRQEVRNGF